MNINDQVRIPEGNEGVDGARFGFGK